MRNYKVVERNWRRSSCEIDIVANKQGVIYFVEVKYRRNDNQGAGFDALTPAKIARMKRSAWVWVEENKWRGQYCIAAVEVGGNDFQILGFIDDLLV